LPHRQDNDGAVSAWMLPKPRFEVVHMKTQKQDLANVFLQIESATNAVEDVSKGILSAVKAAKASTLDQFERMVSEAYAKNGWSQKIGRRAIGETLKSAPRAVKVYVSIIRSAYRLKLKVATYELMEQMRSDIAEARRVKASSAAPEPQRPPEMVGVQVQHEKALTGAL